MTDKEVKILLVEDNPGDVDLTKEVFGNTDFNCSFAVASDGQEAFDYLYNSDGALPDLILLDLNLPNIDGRQVLKKVKEDPKTRRIPVIVLTSSKSHDDVLSAYNDHTNAYVKKPIDLFEFEEVAERIKDFWFEVNTWFSED